MAKIDTKMTKEELDKLVQTYLERKKKTSRIDRVLVYKLYNQFFNKRQRDVNACTCHDRDTDAKVAMYVEKHYKLPEPLPVESNVKIDMSTMTKKTPKKKTTTRKPRKRATSTKQSNNKGTDS